MWARAKWPSGHTRAALRDLLVGVAGPWAMRHGMWTANQTATKSGLQNGRVVHVDVGRASGEAFENAYITTTPMKLHVMDEVI